MKFLKAFLTVVVIFNINLAIGQYLTEGFEASFPPSGWTEFQVDGTNSWQQTELEVNTGTYSAFFDDFNGNNDVWLISPAIDLSSASSPVLTYFENVNFSNWADQHNVLASTDYSGSGDPNLATWNIINSDIGVEDTWIQKGPYDISYYSGSTIYIAWQYVGDYASEWYIDDVLIEEAPATVLSWFNLQAPQNATIDISQNVSVYAQCWEDGVTNADPNNPGAGIECWIGFSTDNTNPSSWSNWVPAVYNVDVGDNDEFVADIGALQGISPGIYYYASRWAYLGGIYTYGGYNSGEWDGTTNISGVLTVNPLMGDECSDAIEINCGDVVLGSTTYATFDNVGTCGTTNTAPGVWYKITGTGEMISASLCGSGTNFDTKLSVFEGTCSTLICIDGNDDYCGSKSRVDWFGVNGNEYYILIHGYSTNTGDYELEIDCSSPSTVTWLGDNDDDWFNPDNWDINDIPGTTTDVIIPAGVSEYPVIDREAICDNIILESDASGSAMLIDDSPLTVLGGATVQQYLTGGAELKNIWHFISPQTDNVLSSVFSGGLLNSYDETSGNWDSIVLTNVPLNVMEGYSVSFIGNQTVLYQGNLASGSQSISNLTYTNNGFPNYDGYNFVGNPYPSAVDIENNDVNLTNLGNAFYFWDNSLNGGLGDYAYWVKGGSGVNDATQYIPPGQGFFLKVNAPGNIGTFSVENTARTFQTHSFYKNSQINLLKLKVEGGNYNDEAIIRFVEGATNFFDSDYDAYKLFASEVNHLYSKTTDDFGLAINTLSELQEEESVSVPLNYEVKKSGIYVITASELESFTNVEITLEDLQTNTTTDLNQNPVCTFTANTGDPTGRFIVHFYKSAQGVEDRMLNNVNIYAYETTVYVRVPENTTGNIIIYNLIGQEIIRRPVLGTFNQINLIGFKGYYLVKVFGNKINTTKKVLFQ